MREGNVLGNFAAKACILFLAFACLELPTHAEPVNPSRAALAARGWYHLRFQNPGQPGLDDTELTAVLAPEAARLVVVKGITIVYAFDIPRGGCIAIAADDEQAPIFYYSRRHRLTLPGVPPAREIMESFADKIAGFQDSQQRETRTGTVHPFWTLLTGLAESRDAADPLRAFSSGPKGPLLTSTWSQLEPYNDKCPMYESERCVVGCVATAMAQVMRYWQHPEKGTGNHCYYWALGGQSVCADFGATTYDWSNMPDELTQFSSPAAKDAVSTLCYHCGVAVDMSYSPYGSGAWHYTAAAALMRYFGYEPPQFHGQVGGMDIQVWYEMMRDQIDEGQPVLYGTQTHEFVLDGYDSPNLVHFNMGWGGEEDGWYAIDHFPLDSASVDAITEIRPHHFELMGIVKVSGDLAQIRWTSQPGRNYAVWSCTDLLTAPWTKAVDISAQSIVTSWTDPSPIAGVKFYRIEKKD
jgi:hypothetical protein